MADLSSPRGRALEAVRFVASATASQVASYFVAGVIASRVLDYATLLAQPVISDYYLPYGSVDVLWSGALQVVRGAMFGLVLLPFRGFLASTRLGWLWLWLVFLAVGIVGTPAASPGSFEGVLYTRLPGWFHLIGLPEIALQTLVFSFLVHRSLRSAAHPLPARLRALLGALAVARC